MRHQLHQDLAVAKLLGDTAGQCRAHDNLGAAYFSQGSYKDRYQLVLAMKCKVSSVVNYSTNQTKFFIHVFKGTENNIGYFSRSLSSTE